MSAWDGAGIEDGCCRPFPRLCGSTHLASGPTSHAGRRLEGLSVSLRPELLLDWKALRDPQGALCAPSALIDRPPRAD